MTLLPRWESIGAFSLLLMEAAPNAYDWASVTYKQFFLNLTRTSAATLSNSDTILADRTATAKSLNKWIGSALTRNTILQLSPPIPSISPYLQPWASICSQSCEGPFPFPFPTLPSLPLPFPLPLPSLPRNGPLKHSYEVWGSAVSSPNGVRGGHKRILVAFRPQNRVWWQQCDMSHNHSLIINIHYFWWMQCSLWMDGGWNWLALAKIEAQFPLTDMH